MKENSKLKLDSYLVATQDQMLPVESTPTVPHMYMLQCAVCGKGYPTTDISQVFCYDCRWTPEQETDEE